MPCAKRPVEQFDTELKLPEWQLEPDDEQMYGNPDDYYYIDEQGNLVEPQRPHWRHRARRPADRSRSRSRASTASPAQPRRAAAVRQPSDDGTQAASDDFLNRATGSGPPPVPAVRPARPRAPVPQPTATQRPQRDQEHGLAARRKCSGRAGAIRD